MVTEQSNLLIKETTSCLETLGCSLDVILFKIYSMRTSRPHTSKGLENRAVTHFMNHSSGREMHRYSEN